MPTKKKSKSATAKEALPSSAAPSSKRRRAKASGSSAATTDNDAALSKAKELYETFVPKMKEFGLPMDQLDNSLLDEVLSKITAPIEKLLATLQEGMQSGQTASKAVSKLSTKVHSSLKTFKDKVPFVKLLEQLPQKLMELIKLITAAISNPSLLLPDFSCASGGGPAELDTAAAHAGMLARKFLGQQHRQDLWEVFAAKFEKIVQPLNEALPQLKELPVIFTSMESSFKNVDNAVKSVKELSSVQGDCEKLLKDLLNAITGKDNSAKNVSVMTRLETAVSKAKSVDGFSATLAKAGKIFSKALNSVFEFFRSLEHLVMKVSSVSWNSLFKSMADLHSHYPTALQDARKIMKPSGATSAFFKPSAYLTKIEDAVKDIQATIHLDEVAKTTKDAAEGLFTVLQLPTGSTKTPAGPAQKEMSSLSVKTLDPIREQFDAVLSLTKVQDLVLNNATNSFGSVLQNDMLGMVQKYVDNFSAAAAKKLADNALAEATRLKDAALAEAEKIKEAAMAAAEKLKEQIMQKANEAKAAVEAQIGELKNKVASLQNEAKQMAADAKDKAEALVADAKAKAQAEIKELTAKANALRAEAEAEVSVMKTKIMAECEEKRLAILAKANETQEQMLKACNKQIADLKSNAQKEVQALKSAARKEVEGLKQEALNSAKAEIAQMKNEALASIKQDGASAASSMFKSFF